MDFEEALALNSAIRTIGIRHRALADSLLAPLGLHTGQEVLLFELSDQGPRSQAQLAASSGCEPPTITGSVRKLEAAGLVVRRPSATDGRITIVELSTKGHELIPQLQQAWCRLADRTMLGVAAAPLGQLTAVLTELAVGLSTRERESPEPSSR